ncbi:MAG: DUF262 domain-containing protein [Algibacter sp.]|uniref:DUF262 domain-containing protein n=1 Tax=Algibacter sp. TaxID=1872428 RepID=UPI0032972099
MSNQQVITNKIDANDRSISDILDKKKYTIDYFQREYKWEQKHVIELLSDLETSFFNSYKEEDERSEVENYNSYYLGPVVFSALGSSKSIIDGQQRITSLTLLLIYLNHLQNELETDAVEIASLVYSEKYGSRTFNMVDEKRKECLESLRESGHYIPTEDDDETVLNLVNRYDDIKEFFPEELKGRPLPFFIDWLKDNVVLVEIIAYSEDNAYTIFETMNDRGLSLSATEMLKGYILSKISNEEQRMEVNDLWKKQVQKLNNEIGKDEDLRFFQSWLRGKYAETIRQGKVGSTNEDFEKIGTRFHTWVKDSQKKIGISTSKQFYDFVNEDFKFFSKLYLKIYKAKNDFNEDLPYLYYVNRYSIANSLFDPLLLAPIKKEDSCEVINQKLNMVARFVETFVVSRSINFKKFSQSSIRYTMYTLVKEIRDKSISELGEILKSKIDAFDYTLAGGMPNFRLHGMNYKFVKYLLCRITGYVEQQVGLDSSFKKFFHPEGKKFEVEHIWADKFEEHKDEFDQLHEFNEIRNRLGDLVLLPNGTNQSYNAMPYKDKYEHYIKENTLVQTLHPKYYENNPNFLNNPKLQGMNFKPYTSFKKEDIEERQNLYLDICEEIWNTDYFLTQQNS